MASDRSLHDTRIAPAESEAVLNALWHLIGRYWVIEAGDTTGRLVLNALWHLIGRYWPFGLAAIVAVSPCAQRLMASDRSLPLDGSPGSGRIKCSTPYGI